MASPCEMPAGVRGFISFHFPRERKISQARQRLFHILRQQNISPKLFPSIRIYLLKNSSPSFFQRNKSLSGFVKCASHEILLRNVKCLRAWVDLFLFTFRASGTFHNERRPLFHIRRIFHFTSSLFFCIIQIRKGGVFYVCFQTS